MTTITPEKKLIFQLERRNILLAAISGILIALSFPNTGLSFTAWFALVPLLISLENSTPKQAAKAGFICGVTAYTIIIYWITIVMTQYGHLPWPVSIPLFMLLVAWLSLFYAAAAFSMRCGENLGIKSAFTLPIAWVAFDYVRLWLFSGFPWAMLGHSQYKVLPVIQIADILGVYGITALIVLANVVLYRVVRAVSGAGVPYPVKSAAIFLLLFVMTLFYGFDRLNNNSPNNEKQLKIALLQGNIPQDVKWSRDFRDKTMSIYSRMARSAAEQKTDLIIFPESAVPFFFQDEPENAQKLRDIAKEFSTYMLIGSPAYELRNDRRTFLNSAFLIDRNGETIGRTDKIHLVPFGEYVPLGRFFPFISKIVVGIGDFAGGEKAVALPVNGTSIGTLVCYEIIFPELTRAYVAAGARIIVNITNDAWFGNSSAPYQHLAIAAFRAVETRTPLVRAANTGITASIDQNGHINSMTPLFKEESRIVSIAPGQAGSIYLRLGNIPVQIAFAITATIIAVYFYKRKKSLTNTSAELCC